MGEDSGRGVGVLMEHGVPKVLSSDQKTKFKNLKMRKISMYFGTKEMFTLISDQQPSHQ